MVPLNGVTKRVPFDESNGKNVERDSRASSAGAEAGLGRVDPATRFHRFGTGHPGPANAKRSSCFACVGDNRRVVRRGAGDVTAGNATDPRP